ncbi:cysteine peptidase family C39 domain-containing protein [Caproicibacter fermentans]|uniref:C10 family peptidase n=1 Tax=Caproicibacter fermentans TaxID=2576756 RepID=A0A7G8T6T8_9FIRM|nr:C10 family peptidase [Caproicibacter fermentans]QNK39329.1 C10 family peptidase [Caproicibacter fermentans]
MLKTWKKAVSLVLVFALSMMVCVPAFADSPFTETFYTTGSDKAKSSDTARIKSFVDTKINAAKAKITVSNTKILHDFAGNEYELVECTPTGYYIIHPQSGIIIESSPNSKSPYKGLNANLYYGGPTYYYIKSGASYKHTILGTTISDADAAAQDCQKIHDALLSQTNEAVSNYLTDKSSSLPSNQLQSTGTDHWVNSYSWFRNLKSGFGYVSGGYCGYIAANLILKYWDNCRGKIKLSSWDSPVNSIRLTNDLIDVGKDDGYGASTYAVDIAKVINDFCSYYSLPQCASWHVGTSGMINEMDSYKRPVILFGNLEGAGNHAVVAYGYNEYENPGDYTFICHFGWNGSSEVHICSFPDGTSIFGSNAQYNIS